MQIIFRQLHRLHLWAPTMCTFFPSGTVRQHMHLELFHSVAVPKRLNPESNAPLIQRTKAYNKRRQLCGRSLARYVRFRLFGFSVSFQV